MEGRRRRWGAASGLLLLLLLPPPLVVDGERRRGGGEAVGGAATMMAAADGKCAFCSSMENFLLTRRTAFPGLGLSSIAIFPGKAAELSQLLPLNPS